MRLRATALGVAGVAGGSNSTAKNLFESCSQKILSKIELSLTAKVRFREKHDRTRNIGYLATARQ